MFAVPEQFSAATKANFETQLTLMNSLAAKAFEGVEKLIELNIHTSKAIVGESIATMQQLLLAKDAQDFFNLSASHSQPAAEKLWNYGRDLSSIAASAQAEFTHAAEVQFSDNKRKMMELVDEVSKNAPAGSEQVIALIKTAVDNVQASYEQLNNSSKQAAEALEAQFNQAVTQASAAHKTNPRASTKK